MKPQFDYATFTAHNIGFVTADEQATRCQTCVFACGVSGMGSAAFMDLLRASAVRPDPQPESLNDPTLCKPGTPSPRRTSAPRCSERVRHDSFKFAALRRSNTATSMLMVCQTISNLLDKATKTSRRGWFFKLYRRSVGGSSWAIAALAPRIGWGRFNRRVSD